ncbi:Disease resistance protein [Thalictrum thalictroides]|uniref:Disease resistance protein n=1 Tax=Thalictrum thalictroides TaxID=46969 RepID=A0A7J6VDD1_THATH|nr:Disease resistance protein [Thalictrum thalictroides]
MEARSTFHLIVDELVSSCLLLRDMEGYVMLHDVVRDVAISIARNRSFIVRAGMNLTQWPNVEHGNCKRLSLMSNKITCFLPGQIEAPFLLTLCLNENSGIKEIPSDFFEGMQNLTTLDLSCTEIQSLPPSFSCLKSLRVLCMDKCSCLVDISQIEWLKRLQILSLFDLNQIRSWESLRKLTTLKMLDLSLIKVSAAASFPAKVISNLHQLEELRIIGRIFEGDDDVNQIEEDGDQSDVGLSEIACLTRLTCLQMTLTSECKSQGLPSYWENLTEFIFVVHSNLYTHTTYFALRLFLVLDTFLKKHKEFKKKMFLQLSSISVPNWILVLSGLTNCLFLEDCPHLKSVEQLDPSRTFDNLKLLSIYRCNSMTHLYSTASCEAKAPMYAFRNLERLDLNYVHKLVAFCDGTLPQGFFQNLKSLNVDGCSKVFILIPCDLLERLQNLEILVVLNTRNMEKLVQLEKSTTNATHSMSSYRPSFPIFPKLRELHIHQCPGLTYLLPMRVLRELKQLEILEISRSDSMVMIVEYENYEDEGIDVDQDKAILPRLKSLDLWLLEQLMSFCPSRLCFDWPALEYLRVYHCPWVNRLPLHTNSAPKLRTLHMNQQWFNGLEWEDESLKSRLQPLLQTKASSLRDWTHPIMNLLKQ